MNCAVCLLIVKFWPKMFFMKKGYHHCFLDLDHTHFHCVYCFSFRLPHLFRQLSHIQKHVIVSGLKCLFLSLSLSLCFDLCKVKLLVGCHLKIPSKLQFTSFFFSTIKFILKLDTPTSNIVLKYCVNSERCKIVTTQRDFQLFRMLQVHRRSCDKSQPICLKLLSVGNGYSTLLEEKVLYRTLKGSINATYLEPLKGSINS